MDRAILPTDFGCLDRSAYIVVAVNTLPVIVDTPALRKDRGAFFTPPAIANYLAEWAVEGDASAKVLDATCGEAVFLQAAGRQLLEAGADAEAVTGQIFGVDLHEVSVNTSQGALADEGLGGTFVVDDFFSLSTPEKLDSRLPETDAVLGNPPFVRYQQHIGSSASARRGRRSSRA